MDLHASDAFWISKLVSKKREAAPKRSVTAEPSLIGTPIVGIESGIRTGWISRDGTQWCREPSLDAELAALGYNSDIGYMQQLRFDRPAFYRAFKDMMNMAAATNETTCCTVIDDHSISQPVFVKISPTPDGFTWVAVRITELLAATLKGNEHLIEEIQNHAIRSVG